MSWCSAAGAHDIYDDVRIIQRIGVGAIALDNVATTGGIAFHLSRTDELIHLVGIAAVNELVGVVGSLPLCADQAIIQF